MSTLFPERVAVVVVRAWLEAGTDLRARIRHTRDIANEPESVTTVAGAEAVEATVHQWIQSFLASSSSSAGRGDTRVTPR